MKTMKTIVNKVVEVVKRLGRAAKAVLVPKSALTIVGVGILASASVLGYQTATKGWADGTFGMLTGVVVGVEKGIHRDEVAVVVDNSDQRVVFAIRHTDDKLRSKIWDSYGDRVRVTYSRAIVPSMYNARTRTALEVKSLWWWQS